MPPRPSSRSTWYRSPKSGTGLPSGDIWAAAAGEEWRTKDRARAAQVPVNSRFAALSSPSLGLGERTLPHSGEWHRAGIDEALGDGIDAEVESLERPRAEQH